MTGDEDSLQTEILPCGRKVGKGNSPIFCFHIYVRLVTERKYSIIGLGKETFVILSVTFIRNFTARLKEGRKEMGGVLEGHGGLRDEGRHVRGRDRS